MVGGKGGAYDDPAVKAAMKAHDKELRMDEYFGKQTRRKGRKIKRR